MRNVFKRILIASGPIVSLVVAFGFGMIVAADMQCKHSGGAGLAICGTGSIYLIVYALLISRPKSNDAY